jgi:hypothetical protein
MKRTQGIPPELMTEANQAVFAHLGVMSAHSDIAEALASAVKPLGDVQLFCPDWGAYRYVAVSTRTMVFGFAIGMDTIAFKLDGVLRSRALTTGGFAYSACGPEWVSFVPFRADWPKVDLEFWALKAYVQARERPFRGSDEPIWPNHRGPRNNLPLSFWSASLLATACRLP